LNNKCLLGLMICEMPWFSIISNTVDLSSNRSSVNPLYLPNFLWLVIFSCNETYLCEVLHNLHQFILSTACSTTRRQTVQCMGVAGFCMWGQRLNEKLFFEISPNYKLDLLISKNWQLSEKVDDFLLTMCFYYYFFIC